MPSHHKGSAFGTSRISCGALAALVLLSCGGQTAGGSGASGTTPDGGADVTAGADAHSGGDAALEGAPAVKGFCPDVACNSAGWCALDPSPTGGDVSALWVGGTDDVWIATGTSVLHWDGHSWSHTDDVTKGPIIALWGTGTSDVWATSDSGRELGNENNTPSEIVHFDGKSWSVSRTNKSSYPEIAIWGSSGRDIWVASYPGPQGALQHYDGKGWTDFTTIGGTWFGPILAIWGSGPNDVWAVGATSGSGLGLTLHWDGTRWSTVSNPANRLGVGGGRRLGGRLRLEQRRYGVDALGR